MRSLGGAPKKGVAMFISFGGRFASSLSLSMSAPPNAIESMPITKPDQSDEEIADIMALAQQLKDTELRNVRITKKRQDWVAEAKRKKDGQDKVDRLTQEAKQKAEKANKKKRVSAILNFSLVQTNGLDFLGHGLEIAQGTIGTRNSEGARGWAKYGDKGGGV